VRRKIDTPRRWKEWSGRRKTATTSVSNGNFNLKKSVPPKWADSDSRVNWEAERVSLFGILHIFKG
jgi:hypothetical protein